MENESMPAASPVLSTVNAPYSLDLSADALASCLVDLSKAQAATGPVFAFFSEVSPALQDAFLREQGLSAAQVKPVAAYFARMSGFDLHLAP